MKMSKAPLAMVWALSAFAATAAAQEQSNATRSSGIDEEIIVTAQRREQSVADVPIAITAVSGEAIRDARMDTAQDLQYIAPNLNVASYYGLGRPDISIRGLTLVESIEFTDSQPVGVYSDDVFLSARDVQLFQMFDLERVEILRGPQGTLFGRNTTGGAVSYYSKLPTGQSDSSFVQGSIGRFDEYALEFGLEAALGDTWAARFSGKHQQREGYGRNRFDGEDFYGYEGTSARILLRRQSEGSDIVFNVHGGTSDEPGRAYTPAGPTYDYYDVDSSIPGTGSEIDALGGSVRATFDLGAFDLVSVTGYEESESYVLEDFTYAQVPPAEGFFDRYAVGYGADQSQWSQELRLVSSGADNIDWVLGLYGFREEVSGFHNSGSGITQTPFGPYVSNRIYTQETLSYAAFGQVTGRLTDTLALTGGIRYTRDEKELEWEYDATLADPIPTEFRDDSWGAVSGRAALEYRFTPGALAYVSFSRGFKAGGYNTGGTTIAQLVKIDPEKVNAYEIGLKTELGERAQLNLAAFFTEAKDFQAAQLTPTDLGFQVVLTNAAEVESKGLELELVARPTEAFSMALSAAWLDAEFKDYVSGDSDYSGNPVPHAPEWSGSLRLAYDWTVAGGTFTPTVSASYKAEQQTRQYNFPGDLLGERTLVDAQLRFAGASGRYSVSLWAKNLLDEQYSQKQLDELGFLGGTGIIRIPGPPRTYGVSATFHW